MNTLGGERGGNIEFDNSPYDDFDRWKVRRFVNDKIEHFEKNFGNLIIVFSKTNGIIHDFTIYSRNYSVVGTIIDDCDCIRVLRCCIENQTSVRIVYGFEVQNSNIYSVFNDETSRLINIERINHEILMKTN